MLYSNGFGTTNFETGEKFTPGTLSCIASVTKQFTAMAIMMLPEKQRLSYDDPIIKYLKLAGVYRGVTIRQLLTHTSGVIDYSHLGSGKPENLILKAKSLRFSPGQKYDSTSSERLLSLPIQVQANVSKLRKPSKPYWTIVLTSYRKDLRLEKCTSNMISQESTRPWLSTILRCSMQRTFMIFRNQN